jgi:hypothetical protein
MVNTPIDLITAGLFLGFIVGFIAGGVFFTLI